MTGMRAQHICSRTTIRVSANAGSQVNCGAVPGMRERCASSEQNSSLFGLIWMTNVKRVYSEAKRRH